MIKGYGCDIVNIQRFLHWIDNSKLLKKYFAEEERRRLSTCGDVVKSSRRNLEILASHFAAKESFIKAVSMPLPLRDIIIQKTAVGMPIIKTKGKAMTRVIQMGVTSIFLSLSHEKEYAFASVLLEGL